MALLLLSACAKETLPGDDFAFPSDSAPPTPKESGYNPSPSPTSEVPGTPSETNMFNGIDWPEPAEIYHPDYKVFPVVNRLWEGAYRYGSFLEGAPVFVDELLRPVQMPFDVTAYAVVYNEAGVAAYMIWGEKDQALMLADGTVPRKSSGSYYWPEGFWGDLIHFSASGSLVVTFHEEDYVPYYGLYDLREQRELLPEVYSSLAEYKGLYFAVKDGEGYLLSPDGRVLYEFGETEVILNDWGEPAWHWGYTTDLNEWAAHWENDPGQHDYVGSYELYLDGFYEPDGEIVPIETFDGTIRRVGNFILVFFYSGDGLRPPDIYTLEGQPLHSFIYGFVFEAMGPGGGMFVWLDEHTCVLLLPNGETIPVPDAPEVRRSYQVYNRWADLLG